MEYRTIVSFMKIAEYKNFTKAAVALGYSQSTVTVQIQQLEDELGIKLFDRIGKQVELTDRGQQFIEYAKQIIKVWEDASNLLKKEPIKTGTLRLGTTESLVSSKFPIIYSKFSKKYPDIELVVNISETTGLTEMLDQNEIDFVYITTNRFKNKNWIKVHEKKERILLVVSPKHPFTKFRDGIYLKDLQKERMISTEKNQGYRQALENECAKQNFYLHIALELANTDVIIRLVKDNLGITYLPEYAVKQALKEHELVAVPIIDCNIEVWAQLFYHKNRWLSEPMLDFIKEIENYED
jgi:DNA-binding transcriptional LysR family regulator